MELIDEAKLCIKGGRKADKHQLYLNTYKKITGKDYPNQKCTGCAVKYLHTFIEHWYKEKLKQL